MAMSRALVFATVDSEGAILPPDLLARIASEDPVLGGFGPADYHLDSGDRLREAASRSWSRLQGAWASFKTNRERLPHGDPGTAPTRERWLLPLFQELGYGRLAARRGGAEVAGVLYPLSHEWGRVPIHLVGCNIKLSDRTKGVVGAARFSPHGLLQSYLNAEDASLWGFLSNGLSLRILRDSSALARQAYVEFDLESMMEGEHYSDFVLLWLLCHQSRVEGPKLEDYWLERWSRAAEEQGTRALDHLREGVEKAITALGRGFLTHPANQSLRGSLQTGVLPKDDYYRCLLRLVYRLLFLFVAEDRDLLLLSEKDAQPGARDLYLRFYSTARLRRLAERLRGARHADVYRGLRVVMDSLRSDEGCPALALPALGSFLWSAEALGDVATAEITNADFLEAVRYLAFAEQDRTLRAIDYRNIGPEELGSVYESLLELHPEINSEGGAFELISAAGHERKTTGSYYTPDSLVQCLLDSALDPVLEEAAGKPNPAEAILALKVCEPACGSGHFLVAAAHRIARRLATVRSGDPEPSPEATRTALRDVIGHCLYGVDVNPMAVELCKVNLWLEALDPGKPLSFLDHRIVCGNSLLGATPALLENGIPDEAFEPIEGDDKALARDLKKRNRREREGKTRTFGFMSEPAAELAERRAAYGSLSNALVGVDAVPDGSISGIHEKETRFRQFEGSTEYRNARLAADAWCAAFVWSMTKDAPPPVTYDVFREIQTKPEALPAPVRGEIERISRQYRFLHWHLAFPDVFQVPLSGEKSSNPETGWAGGFDCVLGNPPWERVNIREREWFAERSPAIAKAPNAAARKRLIAALRVDDPALYQHFLDDLRRAEGESQLMRNSGRYPLCGRGDINVYAIFAEGMRTLLNDRGHVGCLLPTGIATDDTTKFFFQDMVEKKSLISLFDFENKRIFFPGVHSSYKFCLLTAGRGFRPAAKAAEFVFFAHAIDDLRDPERRFTLSAEDIALLNPNTRTCPILRTRADAELIKAIYRALPVLVRESTGKNNPWDITMSRMLHMSDDAHLFRTRAALEKDGARPYANIFVSDTEVFWPLYEPKLIHQFDHRYSTFAGVSESGVEAGNAVDLSPNEKRDPLAVAEPRYWVSKREVEANWTRNSVSWFVAIRGVTATTNERTFISAVIPAYAAQNNMWLLSFGDATDGVACLLGNFNALVFDYVARVKTGSYMSQFVVKQMPVLPAKSYARQSQWSDQSQTLQEWLLPRALELTYTAWDLEPFARGCGWSGPPFRWDEERRFLLRCELDAAFFHLYLPGEKSGEWRPAEGETAEDLARLKASFPTPRDAVAHILDTFPIVRRKDEEKYGDYRTKRVILEIYDAMAESIRTGSRYQTPLDPPPGDPRVAHPPKARPAAVAVPAPVPELFERIHPRFEERYKECVPLLSLKAAAGGFSEDQAPEFEDWVRIKTSHPLRKGMFVAQVVGKSMEPIIPDSSWCLFRYPVLGTRQDRVVLVQHHDIHDPETGGTYTVKRYHSEKAKDEGGTWRHTKITLHPENPAFQPVTLTPTDEGDLKVIAEFLEVL